MNGYRPDHHGKDRTWMSMSPQRALGWRPDHARASRYSSRTGRVTPMEFQTGEEVGEVTLPTRRRQRIAWRGARLWRSCRIIHRRLCSSPPIVRRTASCRRSP